jgi:hypothetical protein
MHCMVTWNSDRYLPRPLDLAGVKLPANLLKPIVQHMSLTLYDSYLYASVKDKRNILVYHIYYMDNR